MCHGYQCARIATYVCGRGACWGARADTNSYRQLHSGGSNPSLTSFVALSVQPSSETRETPVIVRPSWLPSSAFPPESDAPPWVGIPVQKTRSLTDVRPPGAPIVDIVGSVGPAGISRPKHKRTYTGFGAGEVKSVEGNPPLLLSPASPFCFHLLLLVVSVSRRLRDVLPPKLVVESRDLPAACQI